MADSTDTTTRPDRLSEAAQRPFDPSSLVGSFFHSGASPGWQGCIVAEPQPGWYLVELFSWIMGESSDQHLVRIETMAEWTFYDSAEWMNNSYESTVSRRWDQERAERDKS